MLRILDTRHLGTPSAICLGLLGTDSLALIDCGPENVFDHTVESIRQLGLRPEQVTHVLLTQVSLSHAGAAWRWAGEYKAQICAHPNGLIHLADPRKLLESATQLLGENLERQWGRMCPIPAARLRLLHDNEVITLGGTSVRVIATSGCAPRHQSFWIESERLLYAGDVAGVSLGGGPVLPFCPPSGVDLETWQESLSRIRSLAPECIILTHGGELPGYLFSFLALEQRLSRWSDWVLSRLNSGENTAQMVGDFEQMVWRDLAEAGVSRAGIAAYEQVAPAWMSVHGLSHYWRTLRPERLTHPVAVN